MYMKNIYLDHNYYLNNKSKHNIIFNIKLKYYIYKNNKYFIENSINKEYTTINKPNTINIFLIVFFILSPTLYNILYYP